MRPANRDHDRYFNAYIEPGDAMYPDIVRSMFVVISQDLKGDIFNSLISMKKMNPIPGLEPGPSGAIPACSTLELYRNKCPESHGTAVIATLSSTAKGPRRLPYLATTQMWAEKTPAHQGEVSIP